MKYHFLSLLIIAILTISVWTTEQTNKSGTALQFIDRMDQELRQFQTNFLNHLQSFHNEMLDLFSLDKTQKLDEKLPPMTSKEAHKDYDDFNYSFSYTSLSAYTNGTLNTTEHFEMKEPNVQIIADKIPFESDLFDVKVEKRLGNQTEKTVEKLNREQLRENVDSIWEVFNKRMIDIHHALGNDIFSTFPSLLNDDWLSLSGQKETFNDSGNNTNNWLASHHFLGKELRTIHSKMNSMERKIKNEMKKLHKL